MDFIVSLAHFCEVHGPTSILCTQVLSVPCSSCSPPLSPSGSEASPPYSTVPSLVDLRKETQHRSNSEPATRAPSFSRRAHPKSKPTQKSALSTQRHQSRPSSHQRKPSNSSSTHSNAIETPPMSPQLPGPTLPSHQAFYGGSLDRESASTSARPTNTSPDSCANCSLSLPQGVSAQLPAGAPGSPRPDGSGKNGSPVLRTRDEYLVGRPSCNSSSVSSSASSTTSSPSNARRRSRSRTSVAPAIPTQLPSPPLDPSAYSLETVRPGLSPPLHRHSLNYITSRHPQSPASFSLLRSSCIRTLSCEQLPRATSGPLYFGNRASGSTLAYVFRIPDPKALGRGRKRSYALILLGVDERRTMAVSAWVLRRFEMMADWIVGMAEAASGETEALRPEPGLPDVEARYGDVNRIGGLQGSGIKGDGVSAFLSGRSGWDRGEGWGAGRQADVRARGLAELCGKEDVFVELHRQFVCLLVGILRGGGPGGLGDLGDDWDE